MSESPVQLRLIDFVQAVMERPYLYTEQSSYYEVAAYIKGYLTSLPNQHFGFAPWFEFLEWLKERQGEGEDSVLVRFRGLFDDDRAALTALHG